MPGGHEGPRRVPHRGPRDSFNDFVFDSHYDFDNVDELLDHLNGPLSEFSDDDSIFGDLDRGPRGRAPRHGRAGYRNTGRRVPRGTLLADIIQNMTTEEAERIIAEGRGGIDENVAREHLAMEGRGEDPRRPGGFGGPGRMQIPIGAGGQRAGLGGRVDEPYGTRGPMPRPYGRPGMQGGHGRFGGTFSERTGGRGGFGMGRHSRGGRPSSLDNFDDDEFFSDEDFDDSFRGGRRGGEGPGPGW